MCLNVDFDKTEQFKKRNRNKREVVVWKYLKIMTSYGYKSNVNGKEIHYLASPFQLTVVNAGWYKAEGESYRLGFGRVYEGIHAFTTRKQARKESVWHHNSVVIRCEALMKDLIAVGTKNDIVFSKIWIPKEQLK